MKILSNSLNFFFFKYNKFVSHIQFCRDIMKTKLLFCINIHWDGITMICADNLSNTGQGLQHHRLQKPVSFSNKTSWDNTEHIGPPISLTIQNKLHSQEEFHRLLIFTVDYNTYTLSNVTINSQLCFTDLLCKAKLKDWF